MSPTTVATTPVHLQVDVIRAVARAKHPKIDMPTIAGNRDLSFEVVKTIVDRAGYPDIKRMLATADRLAASADTIDDGLDPDTGMDLGDIPTTLDRAAPYIAAVPISQLFADPAYQRPLDELRVQRMAAKYDVALVGIIEVSARPDSRYAILDGQHRWATVRDVAFNTTDETPHVPCRIHTGLTVAEEAKLYHQLNTTRKQLTGWDRWLARRGAGDQDVADIEACAARHDLIVGMQAGSNVLRATKACENVVALGGIPLLDATFNAVRSAYRNDQNGLDAAILYGTAHVLHNYTRDEFDPARLVDAMSGIMPRQLVARAAALRELHKGTMDRLTAHVLVEQYNGLKGPKLQPFFDRVRPHVKNKTRKLDGEARRREAIRTWAIREGLMASDTARIRKHVREAYDAAHATECEAS